MIDTLVNNRYRIDGELGHGGMGTVFRAHDTLLDRDVAIKVLSKRQLGSDGRARLLREAQAVAQLNHPNIISIHDAGEADNVPFIVMELVNGESLHMRRPDNIDAIIAIIRQLCAALEHAHLHNIIHRDLKPENVLIGPDGVAKLMDFGLARTDASRVSNEGTLRGTVFYLAPEQARGETVDGRADLYALGVMLYELTTGHLPFSNDDPLVVITQHLHTEPAPPSTHRADLPAALEAIILKLLAKKPEDRFSRAGEVAQALAQIGAEQPPTTRNNLPNQLTSFVGREKEMAEIKRLLAGSRLLTLTGPGGTGKTRLALQVAADMLDTFEDGVWLVELATLSEAVLIPQTIAALLGVREEPNYPLTKSLADYLRPRSLLLILDNCEHLIEACAQFAETLLRACPKIKILTTSRETLGIAGETLFRVPSLSLPDPQHLPALDTLAQFESIRLFVERAVSVKPEFTLRETNAPAIAQICQQLDGVPLAIELAAACVRMMAVDQVAARLDDRFRLLTGGSRTALPRQQTLRALIDWSWDLLSGAERALLRRLAVFLNGWTLEAAERVTSNNDTSATLQTSLAATDILHLLIHLVEKSLVVVEEHGVETRYFLLETIRQYAQDKLLESGEAAQIRSCHLEFFLSLSEEAEPRLRTADQLIWLKRLEIEHDNLRAALKWARGNAALAAGLSMAGNLSRFWYLRGYWNEGREWLKLLLAQRANDDMSLARARSKALMGAGWLADDDGTEIAYYTESLDLCRRIGDKWGEAFSLRGAVSSIRNWGDAELILPRLHKSLTLFRELNDDWGVALVLFNLGWLALNEDDPQQAETCWEEALQLFRRSGDRWGIAVTLSAMAYIARLYGKYPNAAALTQESLMLFRELGDKAGIALSMARLGSVASRRGDFAEAIALIEESITLQRERGDQQRVVDGLNGLGIIAGYQGDYARAETTLNEALTIAKELGMQYDIPSTLSNLAFIAYDQGDLDRAEALWNESARLHRAEEEKSGLSYALHGLGWVAYRRNDIRSAQMQLDESFALCQTISDKRGIAALMHALGKLAQVKGDRTHAWSLLCESLIYRKKMGDKLGIAETLGGIASMCVTTRPDAAARLFGASESIREAIAAPLPPIERDEYERDTTATRNALGQDAFANAWAEGCAMSIEQAIAFALEVPNE